MTMTAAPTAKKSTYAPLELFDTDRLLDADERDIAATVRKFVDTRLKPNVEEWFESATLPRELAKEFGALGVLGMHLDGYGCAGHQRRQLRPGLSGAGGRRHAASAASSRCRARCRCSRSGPLRLRGAEERVAAAAGRRRGHRLLRPDRARLRLQPRRDAHPGPPRRQRLGPQRHQDVDHQRRPRRRGHRLGADRRRHPRLPRARPTHPGFTASEIHRKLSLRASVTSELVLDDVRLPARRGCPSAGACAARCRCLNEARFGIVFGAIGRGPGLPARRPSPTRNPASSSTSR